MTKSQDEKKDFKEILKDKSIIALVGFVLRYKTKELLFIIIVLLLGYVLAANLKYSKDGGWEWIPYIKTNVEIKK